MEDYCKAISEIKLPATPSGSGPRNSCFDHEEHFQEFVNLHMDLNDLDHHIGDFTPQSSDMAQALHTIRSGLESGLSQRLGCTGSLMEIDSVYDGNKTGRLDVMDCLYLVTETDVKIQQVGSSNADFIVYLKSTEVKPKEINKKLIVAMMEILPEMTLPDGWKHGGYASPDFSGPRCNGSSVTAMFCNKDEKHISLEVSIAFPLTSQLQQRADFPSQLRDSCRYVTTNINKIRKKLTQTQISADLHLIGNLIDDTWQPTTAMTDAEVIRALRPESSVKHALEICTVIASKLQKWFEEHHIRTDTSIKEGNGGMPAVKRIRLSSECKTESILGALLIYSSATTSGNVENQKGLNEAMAYQHIYLPAPERRKFKEGLESDTCVNNVAIKHIIMKTALHINDAFSKPDKQLKMQLIRAVFEELSSTDSFYTHNAFVPDCMISKFSVSIFLSRIKESVASDLSQQCRIVLQNVFGKPPVDYGSLKVTREHRIQSGDKILGMCYHSGRLYIIESRKKDGSYKYILVVYSVTSHDSVTPLDTLDLEGDPSKLDIDHQSGKIYIPCGDHGICVVRYDGSKLVPVTTLRCVERTNRLAVVSANTLYAGEWKSNRISLVDVNQDRITARLRPPRRVKADMPHSIAVVGNTVLLLCGDGIMVIYQYGVTTPGKVLPRPEGLLDVWGLTTDHNSSFLVPGGRSHSVYVLDIRGNLTHTIPIPGQSWPWSCTVVEGQLWVGCLTGEILVMSSQP